MQNSAYHETELNVGNTIYPGFNDINGIMICGYEYGNNKHDQFLERECQTELNEKTSQFLTFFNKSQIYNSPYDKRIIKWFNFFGHPLGANDGNSDFDKCLLQSNWCDSQGTYVNDYDKFLAEENIQNFLKHVRHYAPLVLIFMGSKLIEYLQNNRVKNQFKDIFGDETSPLNLTTKNYSGRKFKIGFQGFEKIKIISLPHPCGTRGLSDEYIKLFKPEICSILEDFKKIKGL